MSKVKIKVPATTANLGPGFDSLGCALSMYNTFEFDNSSDTLKISGCDERYCNSRNLCYFGYKAVLDELGAKDSWVSINIDADIPISRGLGSSSTLLVAGAMAANKLNGNKLNKDDILNITNKIEGHPDNLTPAIYGGLTASFVEDGKPYIARFNISSAWKFVVLIPDFKLKTSVARDVLPDRVTRQDAIFNISHSSLVLNALDKKDEELLIYSMQDKIHQQYRAHLIDDFDIVQDFAKENNIAFCISGAGPTLLCVTLDKNKVHLIEKNIPIITNSDWEVACLSPELSGAKIL